MGTEAYLLVSGGGRFEPPLFPPPHVLPHSKPWDLNHHDGRQKDGQVNGHVICSVSHSSPLQSKDTNSYYTELFLGLYTNICANR